jgi:hypothetical protein
MEDDKRKAQEPPIDMIYDDTELPELEYVDFT